LLVSEKLFAEIDPEIGDIGRERDQMASEVCSK
jgi:hypothetical protein